MNFFSVLICNVESLDELSSWLQTWHLCFASPLFLKKSKVQCKTLIDFEFPSNSLILIDEHENELCEKYILDPQCERVFTQRWCSMIHKHFTHIQSEECFHMYHRYRTPEQSYLELLQRVLNEGETRKDRTGVGTLSLFGPQIEFDLQHGFPMVTTKRINFSHIAHEVLWYISGSTNTEYLVKNNVHVWNANTSRQFLDHRGLSSYDIGETGPLYGFQWRHFGGDFRNVNMAPGVDQLQNMLNLLRKDPTSRRIFMSAWNPMDLDKMCLEPCHVSFQLYVRSQKYLDGKLYMRSNDLFLGAPWNIAAYSLLIYMFAHLTGYVPGKLVYSLGDAHLYSNHLEQVKLQLQRPMRPLPKLSIDSSIPITKWEDFTIDHFVLENYYPHLAIRAPMAV